MKRRYIQKTPFTLEHGGKTYSAEYWVEKGVITVSWNFRENTTLLGSSPPLSLARILLREMIPGP